jgi:nicotinamidase-related amidase
MTSSPEALVCIDYISEIVAETGKLAAKGYASFVSQHMTLDHLARRQSVTREGGGRVIHVHLGFLPDYSDCPASSPLFSGAKAAGILKLGTTSTDLVGPVSARSGDIVLVKKRVSAFYGTALELTLRSLGVQLVTIAGVSTDLAVQSAAREAHDRDFIVQVASDCCAAASEDDHNRALANMAKFSTIL